MTTFVGAYAQAAETLHERIGEMGDGLPGNFAQRMASTVSNVAPLIHAIGDMIAQPDPERSDHGNYLKAADKADAADRHTTTALNMQAAIATEWEADLVRRENAAAGFDRGSKDAERILNKFAAKSQAEQVQDLAQWMKDKQRGGMYIGLVTAADEYATNLSPEMAQRFRTDYLKLHYPDLAHEREAKDNIWEAARAAAGLTSRVRVSISDPRRLADIRDRKAKHSAADSAFLAALGGVT